MSILIIDDQPDNAQVVASLIRRHGLGETCACSSAESALALLAGPEGRSVDFIVSDLRMPGMSGLQLLQLLRERRLQQPFVLVTAYAEIEDAKAAIRSGATEYLVKPFDAERLIELIRRHRPGEDPGRRHGLIGRSPAMRRLVAQIDQAAQSEATLMITGESGTGKEPVARALHEAGPRRDRSLIAVNSAAIVQSLGESALFGHETGSFTGADRRHHGYLEQADGGTLFLDEIGDMPLPLQGKLLRAIQEQRFQRIGGRGDIAVDVRFLAATHRQLGELVDSGDFRADLYYRLNVLSIHVPPLRERGEDVVLLARHFLSRAGVDPGRLGPAAAQRLCAHQWPGNVRECEAVCQRLALGGGHQDIGPADIDSAIVDPTSGPFPIVSPPGGSAATAEAAGWDMQAHERQLIRSALERASGNKSKAAKLLGISRRRLYSRLEVLGIDG